MPTTKTAAKKSAKKPTKRPAQPVTDDVVDADPYKVTIINTTTWKVGEETFKSGDRVSCLIEWPGGRRTTTVGTLTWISAIGKEAVIDSTMGPVAGSVETLEHE